MGRVVYGYWDCENCGRKKIRGDNKECPSCGTPVNENTRFYMDENTLEDVKPSKVNDSPNWVCSYCNSQNDAKETQCTRCGASRNENKGDYFTVHRAKERRVSEERKPDPTCAPRQERYSYSRSSKIEESYSEQSPVDILHNPIIWMIVGIVAVLALIAWLAIPITRNVEVSNFYWEREISVEELRTFHESDWDLPAGARNVTTKWEYKTSVPKHDHYENRSREVDYTEIVGTRKVSDGWKDKGNGQFEEESHNENIVEHKKRTEYYTVEITTMEPVYATKYYYDIDRWVYSRSVTTSGADKKPYWGEVVLNDKERKGESREKYQIGVILEDSPKYFELKKADWEKLKVGAKLKIKTFRFGTKVLSYDFLMKEENSDTSSD